MVGGAACGDRRERSATTTRRAREHQPRMAGAARRGLAAAGRRRRLATGLDGARRRGRDHPPDVPVRFAVPLVAGDRAGADGAVAPRRVVAVDAPRLARGPDPGPGRTRVDTRRRGCGPRRGVAGVGLVGTRGRRPGRRLRRRDTAEGRRHNSIRRDDDGDDRSGGGAVALLRRLPRLPVVGSAAGPGGGVDDRVAGVLVGRRRSAVDRRAVGRR